MVVDPKGAIPGGVACGSGGAAESRFRSAKSIKQSVSHSMPTHRPAVLGQFMDVFIKNVFYM
ncbi:MAG: hypothetical protein ACOY58_04090 [Candidatus Micrarchaeota archaeon]